MVLDDNELQHKYLQRLQLDPTAVTAETPSFELLAKLIDAHVCNIAFENLDQHTHEAVPPNLPAVPPAWVENGRPILEDPRLTIRKFTRDATDLRGGFCFEVNLAFSWLLRRLGFDVELRLSQVGTGENPDTKQFAFAPLSHVVPVVKLDGVQYTAEVGCGDCPRAPLEIPHASARQRTETLSGYSVATATVATKDKVGESWLVGQIVEAPEHDQAMATDFPIALLRNRRLKFAMGEEWLDRRKDTAVPHIWHLHYRFSEKAYESNSTEFCDAIRFVLTHPQSGFVQKRLVMRCTPTGHQTLSERRFKVVDGMEVREHPVQSMAHWRELLLEHFGMTLASGKSALPAE